LQNLEKAMQELEFTLDKEFIELNKLLKILSLVESGGQANAVISEGYVVYNGEVDTRKRLKLRKGDEIEFAETLIRIS
jgi:ribosome-associated protein